MKFGGWQRACRYATVARDAEIFASVARGLLHSGVRDVIAMGIFAIRQRRSPVFAKTAIAQGSTRAWRISLGACRQHG
jgi:hypothetical protein